MSVSPPTATQTALRARGVRKAFGEPLVLAGVDLTIRPGQTVGVVGENGAGKTTLLRILYGDLRPDRGTVAASGTLGHCPQHPAHDKAPTPYRHPCLYQEALHPTDLDHARELVDRLAFADHLHVPVTALSGGTRHKLSLVRSVGRLP